MSESKNSSQLTRRTFIKTLGAGVAGVTLSGSIPGHAGADTTPSEPGTAVLSLRVNGEAHQLRIESRETLADVLRDRLGLTGTKVSCERGMCGTCTVLLDDTAVYSCHTLALDAEGRNVTTVEGLLDGEELHPLQQAFVEKDGLQCGYCTPGQVMSAHALLLDNPDPSADEIRAGLAGNLCRCGAYPKIVESVLAAKETTKGGGS